MDILFPGYSEGKKYTIEIGTIPDNNMTIIPKIIDRSYSYRPVFPWLEYIGVANVIMPKDEISRSGGTIGISVKEGVFNIEAKE